MTVGRRDSSPAAPDPSAPAEAPRSDAPPSRVLVAGGGALAGDLAAALSAQGHLVITLADLSEAPSGERIASVDAIVLDLTAAGGAPSAPSWIGEEARRSSGEGGGPHPFVVALTADGAVDGPAAGVDLSLPARQADQVVRALAGAVAARRLSIALEQIDRLNKAVMHARSTAHDLAQPLTTIIARAQLLLGTLKEDDPHRKPVTIICQESERLAGLIEQFQKVKEIARPPDSPEH